MNRIAALCAFLLAITPILITQAAEESSADDPVMEEIVVTATYRETDLMETPVSLSAVTDEMVENTGAESMEGLFTMIPGLNMVGGGRGDNGNSRYSIRGVSAQSGDIGYAPTLSTVGIYIDGTPVTSALGPDNQVSGTLFDIDRVEVLKGPQGTLFGEGSQGGTIRFIYKQPDPSGFDFAVNASGASMDESDDSSARVDAMVNVPLGDRSALRLTGWSSETAGFIDNETPVEPDYNTGDSTGARAALRFEGDSWSVTGTLHHSIQGTGGASATDKPFTIRTARFPGLLPFAEDKVDIYSLTIEKDFGWATFESLTSYLDRTVDTISEGTAGGASLLDFFYFGALEAGDHEGCEAAVSVGAAFGLPGLCGFWPGIFNLQGPVFTGDGRNILAVSSVGDIYTEQTVQEFRLVSPADQRLRWTLGAFWKDSEDHYGSNQVAGYYPGRTAQKAAFDPFLQGNPANNHDDFIEEIAIFGEMSYDLTDTLEVTAGVRLANVKQNFQRADRQTDDSPVSPKLVFAWKPLEDLMVYGGYTTGFRPGNVNNNLAWYASTFFANNGFESAEILSGLFFDGDEVDSYELGVKTTILDGRVALMGAAYFLEWHDMIVHEQNRGVGTGDIYNVNSGGADIKGFEIEVKAYVTDRLHIRISGDDNDTEVTRSAEFSTTVQGNELTFAPSNTFNVAIDYSLGLANGGSVDFYLDRAWVSEQFTDSRNTLPIPKYERSNGRITYHSANDKWTVSLFGTNLENQQILRGRTSTGVLFWHNPRQIGLEFGYQL